MLPRERAAQELTLRAAAARLAMPGAARAMRYDSFIVLVEALWRYEKVMRMASACDQDVPWHPQCVWKARRDPVRQVILVGPPSAVNDEGVVLVLSWPGHVEDGRCFKFDTGAEILQRATKRQPRAVMSAVSKIDAATELVLRIAKSAYERGACTQYRPDFSTRQPWSW